MAEALWRNLAGSQWECFSAGSNPAGYVHPNAIKITLERGIDISRRKSKNVTVYKDGAFDFVLMVCDHARESCPIWPKAGQTLHWFFEDPASATGSESEKLARFRSVRDQIATAIERFLIQ